MRVNREAWWLAGVVVALALAIRWTGPPQAAQSQPIRVGSTFRLTVQGDGYLVIKDRRNPAQHATTVELTVAPHDGDLVRASDMAHLYPKVQLPRNVTGLEILPGGEVNGVTQDGARHSVGQILLTPQPGAAQAESLVRPGQAGTGSLLVTP